MKTKVNSVADARMYQWPTVAVVNNLQFMFRFSILLCLMQSSILGSQVLEIAGHYDVVNYIAGKPSKEQSFSTDFVVRRSETSWDISVTNTDNPQSWEKLVYDGTNSYSLMPYEGHYESDLTVKFFGSVTPSSRYNMTAFSDVDIFIPWIVFALSPSFVTPEMPRPWGYIYKSLAGYGYRWSVIPSEDGRFLAGFKIVRDKSLDLDEKSEFLRPNFAYPQTPEELQRQRMYLESRMGVPNGFLEATYAVDKWLETNGWTIPQESKFVRNAYGGGGVSYPAETIKIKVNQVTVRSGTIMPPALSDKTFVRDFRYTRRENDRMYRYAEYVQSGTWRAENDPSLVTEQQNYLKHGPKFGHYGFWTTWLVSQKNTKLIIVWALFVISQAVAITLLIRHKLKPNKR